MRVAFVLPSFAGGGAERVTLLLMAALDRSAFEPELIAVRAEGPLASIVPEDVPVHALGAARLRGSIGRLGRTLARIRPEVVFASQGHLNVALVALRRVLRGHYRLVLREPNLPSLNLRDEPHPRLFQLFYRLCYPRADRVITSSERMAGELRARCRVPAERLSVLPNPVDETGLRARVRTPRRMSEQGTCFVASGRLVPQKGFDRLLDVMADLPPATHLAILGDGFERAALEARARRLGLGRRVAFRGFEENPWAWYAGADAFVLPSRWEGTPNAALEALACGTPVIVSPAAGGLVEAADLAPHGAVRVAESADELAEAMRATSPRPREALAPSLLPGVFRLPRVARRFEALLREAAGGDARPLGPGGA